MYTQCPHCQTRFRIHAAELRAAKGQVRCGTCHQAFDALAALTESPDPAEAITSSELAAAQESALTLPEATGPEALETNASRPETATEPSFHTDPAETVLTSEPPSLNQGIRLPQGAPLEVPVQQHNIEIPLAGDGPVPPATESAPPAAPAGRRRLATVGWTCLNLALIILVMAQGAYLLRDELAHQPALQPLLTTLCQPIDCEVPLPRAPDQIQLVDRTVRSHPDQPGALLIEATFVNEAEFHQPYPLLQLRLFDLNGQPVAGRRFEPRAYLAADSEPTARMAPGERARIELELMDPGAEAVSFEFEFL